MTRWMIGLLLGAASPPDLPAAPPPVRIWIPLTAFGVALGALAAVLLLPRVIRVIRGK